MPQDVRVERKRLLDILTEHRDEHKQLFTEALAGWERRVQEELEKALEEARAGKQYRTRFNLPQPEDHTRDYDRAIAMVEMEVREEVTLSEREFAQMVLDDWGWKPDFISSYSAYTVTEGE